MSIVTYENVDTPVFELDTMRYLFRDGLQGMWIDFLPGYAFADTDLTTPANPGEGIAGYVDRGPYGYDDTQPVITARPIFRVGPPRAEYDGADDVLPSSLTIPSISEGCFILVGTAGIWIDNEYSNTSGTLSVGPATYTNGPAGILPVVGNILSIIWREEPLTDQERQKVIQAGVRRGSAGLITVGPELVVNGDFSDGLQSWNRTNPGGTTGWVGGAGFAETSTAAETPNRTLTQVGVNPPGNTYIAEIEVAELQAGSLSALIGAGDFSSRFILNSAGKHRVVRDPAGGGDAFALYITNDSRVKVESVSVRQLVVP